MTPNTNPMHRHLYRVLLVILPALLIAACSVHYKAGGEGKVGYASARIDGNTFNVTYVGEPRETADLYNLFRCAELTAEEGFDYFIVVDHNGSVETSETQQKQPYTNQTIVSTSSIFTETRTIKVFKGTKPASDMNAYNAREVIANLGPSIKR
jgi:hypothetical protein